MTRQEALSDAINTAMARELGAYATSETVLNGSELIVNRRGQATRGSVEKAVAIGAPVINADKSMTLRTRVTLCRNMIRPEERTQPSNYISDGDMQKRSQAMLDISDSRSDASLRKKQNLTQALSALLNPQVGPQLHEAEVISYEATDISTSPTSQSHGTKAIPNSNQQKYVLFNVVARVAIDKTVRNGLLKQLNNIAVGHHSPGLFGQHHTNLISRPGLVSVKQRFEHLDNQALHPSDRQYAPMNNNNSEATDAITEVTIVKALTETTSEDAAILRTQLINAVNTFSTNGLSLIGWSANQPVVELPLFDSTNSKSVQLTAIAFYPEAHKGDIQRSNGVVFASPQRKELKWLSHKVSPLGVLSGKQPNGGLLALRQGGSRLEINLAIHRDIGSRISRFTIQPTRGLHTKTRNALSR